MWRRVVVVGLDIGHVPVRIVWRMGAGSLNAKPRVGGARVARAVPLLVVLLASAIAVGSAGARKLTPAQQRQVQESRYIERAVLPAVNSPVCKSAPVPATVTGPAPAPFLSILGVLRLPSSSADVQFLSRSILSHSDGLYVDDVRLARQAFDIDWYVYVAGSGFLPPANVPACLAAQSANFSRELPSIPKRLRAGTESMFARQLSFERSSDARPMAPGVCLIGFRPSGGGGGGCGATAADIEARGSFGTRGTSHRALINGVVPDGVATVTFCYPAGPASGFSRKITLPAVCIKGQAINNVVVVSVPRGAANALGPMMTWRNAGQLIKTIPPRS